MCAQRREDKQQFYKTSKWQLLTPVEIENHLIPFHFNSKGDYLRSLLIFLPYSQTSALDICEVQNAVCHVKPSFDWKYRIRIKDRNSIINECKTIRVCVLQSRAFDKMTIEIF